MKSLKSLLPILIIGFLFSYVQAQADISKSRSIKPRIVGGSLAPRGAWPFMVGLFASGTGSLLSRLYCGGTLVHQNWVVTAGHCVHGKNASSLVVGIGLNDLASDTGEIKTISRIIPHPSFNNSTLENDIALIELSSASTSGIPISPYSGPSNFQGITSTAIGWGLTSENGNLSNTLNQVDLPVLSNSLCGINSTQLCAGFSDGGKDACQGDSGGPLVIGTGKCARFVGLTSSGSGCARPGEYGVWTRISSFTAFINQYVPSFSDNNGDYGLWNGFLNMINIVELQNPSSSSITAKVNVLDNTGAITSSISVPIAAQDQYDVILNELQGFCSNEYGLVQVSNNVTGRIAYYRPNSVDPNRFDFSYNVPVRSGISSASYVSFNTFQPSTIDDQLNNLVANWLSIVNLETSSRSYTLNKYNQAGSLLSSVAYTLNGRSRVDVEGGHGNPGSNAVGYMEVIPNDASAKYLSQLIRYGYGTTDFEFAFPLEARPASTSTKFIPLGSGAQNQNWIEIVNLSNQVSANTLKIFSQDGSLLYNGDIVIAARSQTHFNASEYIPWGSIGLAEVSPTESKPYMAQSMIYYKVHSNGGIASLAGLQTIPASMSLVRSSYNLYLSMEGYLQIQNPLDTPSIVDISIISQASSGSSFTDSLGPRQSKSYYLNDSGFGTVSDSYGSVLVTPRAGSQVFGATFRVRREGLTPDIQYVNPGVLE